MSRSRPSNTSMRDLLGAAKSTEIVLDFLTRTRVGEVKEGILKRISDTRRPPARLSARPISPFCILPVSVWIPPFCTPLRCMGCVSRAPSSQ